MRTENLLITVNIILLVTRCQANTCSYVYSVVDLAIFEPDKNDFLGLLMRLALSDSSPSSVAVLQSAFALSSFHRHGLQASVFRFKARALRALIISSNHCTGSPTIFHHIAASMILCHLEVCSSMDPCLLFRTTTHPRFRCLKCQIQYPYGSVSDFWSNHFYLPGLE